MKKWSYCLGQVVTLYNYNDPNHRKLYPTFLNQTLQAVREPLILLGLNPENRHSLFFLLTFAVSQNIFYLYSGYNVL